MTSMAIPTSTNASVELSNKPPAKLNALAIFAKKDARYRVFGLTGMPQ